MASLHEVIDISRHILVIGVLCIAGIFILFTGIRYYKNLHPVPPPPPTVAFGKLPSVTFPQSTATQQLQYTIDTLSGKFPDFPNRVTVYKIRQASPTLNALQNATSLVHSMGYSGAPVKVSDALYKWTNTDDLPKTLLLNIYTNDFAISSPYTTNQDVVNSNNLPDQNSAIDTVMSFLQNSSLLPTDIDNNKTKATLLSISGTAFLPSTSLSSTQVIQVDLFQKDQNSLPLFYPNPTHSTMSLFVAGGSNFPQIILANFNHQSILPDNATYPMISAQHAFDELKKGKGYIASVDHAVSSVTIHNIVLGYFMSDKPQQYLEPVIVFEGDNGFYAYVPAVEDQWINQ